MARPADCLATALLLLAPLPAAAAELDLAAPAQRYYFSFEPTALEYGSPTYDHAGPLPPPGTRVGGSLGLNPLDDVSALVMPGSMGGMRQVLSSGHAAGDAWACTGWVEGWEVTYAEPECADHRRSGVWRSGTLAGGWVAGVAFDTSLSVSDLIGALSARPFKGSFVFDLVQPPGADRAAYEAYLARIEARIDIYAPLAGEPESEDCAGGRVEIPLRFVPDADGKPWISLEIGGEPVLDTCYIPPD